MEAKPQIFCPTCKHEKCVPGSIDPRDIDDSYPSSFHPDGIRHWYSNPGSKLQNGAKFYCCLNCGLVWSFTDPNKIMSILEKLGVPKGQLPERASYSMHFLKWMLFLLASLGLAVWIIYFDKQA